MKNRLVRIWMIWVLMLTGWGFLSGEVAAGSIYESPYVTFSPDKRAFTTSAGEKNYQWYEEGTRVNTGMSSSLGIPQIGEHEYRVRKEKTVKIGSWVVEHGNSSCCHNNYPPIGVPYHDIIFGRKNCLRPYHSGWIGNCADCGEQISPLLIYMSKEAAQSITVLDLSLDYYYLCPHCTNLEQGSGLGIHYCKAISWNRYQVRYDSNTFGTVGGYMQHSFHMYNNETVFEGKNVTPQTRLSPNTYTRTGYVFQGWNTRPDGSGDQYSDQAKIWNLTAENYDMNGGGVVTLYAQWKPSESILHIDPAGGNYQGKSGITEIFGGYGSSMELKASDLSAPAGYRVSFETNGGSEITPVTGTMSFEEWIQVQPFQGKFKESRYYFVAENGHIDLIKAAYQYDPVELPRPVKSGHSFGGWFFDENGTMPAGNAGDTIIPTEDMILYAKWADLVLTAQDNYTVNGGKGAVDLAWQQEDGTHKSYQVFQSRNGTDWTLLSDAEDSATVRTVEQNFTYSGKMRNFTVPYTGLYILTGSGAQGGNYGNKAGGKGGEVSGSIWLERGEILTCTVGGQDGFPDGGKATDFADGGGSSSIYGNRKGRLLTAGGGGGATSLSDGGKGGSLSGTHEDSRGADGAAGGGGGYYGGIGGEVKYHYHTDSCYVTEDTSYIAMSAPDDYSSWAAAYGGTDYKYGMHGEYYGYRDSVWGVYGHGKGEVTSSLLIGESHNTVNGVIPVNGNQRLHLHLSSYAWGEGGIQNGSLNVYDQNGRIIFAKALAAVPRYHDVDEGDEASINSFERKFEVRTGGKKGTASGWYCFFANVPGSYVNKSSIYWNETVVLPEGTTGVKIGFWTDFGDNSSWISSDINEIAFSGERKIQICGYTNGQLISAQPAFGGSNYINAAHVKNYSQQTGVNSGNGRIQISSVSVGYLNVLELNGVAAPDCAAPDPIGEATVKKTAVDEEQLLVSWEKPQDHGTVYYHKAQSYSVGSTEMLSESNITRNELISGVTGYYYCIDSVQRTEVGSNNGKYISSESVKVGLTEQTQYFHAAPVDGAGNIGKTIHLKIGKTDQEVAWPLFTKPISVISEQNSVYEKASGYYYVKCDDMAPFTVQSGAFMKGNASVGYQMNYFYFDIEQENERIEMELRIPSAGEITDRVENIPMSEIGKVFSGSSALKDDLWSQIRRSDRGTKLTVEQRFTMAGQMNGKMLKLIPGVGADTVGGYVRSDRAVDENNSVILIGDNEPPVIRGTEALEDYLEAEEKMPDISFYLEAEDKGAGVAEFYIRVINQNNGAISIFPAKDGKITLEISEGNSLFQGNYLVELHVSDRVGNTAVSVMNREFFSVSAFAERILEPHEPVFRGGEGGRIVAIAYGYVDQLEIVLPEELLGGTQESSVTLEYGGKYYRVEEEFLFGIPLKVLPGEYQIIVNARKGGEIKSSYPVIWTLEGESVADDIRTRRR